MRVGFFLPNIGQVGNANTLVRVARRAEELGYDSLWVTDRLFYAVKPKTSFYGAGRNPADLKIATRYNLSITPKPLGSDRHIFSGSIDQIREDVEALKDFGPDELVFDVTFSADSQSEEGFLKNLERLHKFI